MAYTLAELIERARTIEMTSDEREQQRRSFAYGNTSIENDLITRAMVDECAETLKRRPSG
ncbi:MAG TPA: hypothetical protein VGR52_04520 [Stellaceae bacterium]|nr:hypothetical protein [Stellaceae bacterium]